MKINYRFPLLSPGEREFHAMVLLDEIDMQSWYTIRFSSLISEEVFVILQSSVTPGSSTNGYRQSHFHDNVAVTPEEPADTCSRVKPQAKRRIPATKTVRQETSNTKLRFHRDRSPRDVAEDTPDQTHTSALVSDVAWSNLQQFPTTDR